MKTTCLTTYMLGNEREFLALRDWPAVSIPDLTRRPHEGELAAHTLTKFAKTVDTARVGEPAGLIVITASGSAYTRPDGVRVVPITTLGP